MLRSGRLKERHDGHKKKVAEPVNPMIREYFEGTVGDENTANEAWMLKHEFPTAEEILGSDGRAGGLLEPNKIQGPWSSAKKYLRTHYDLNREDVIAPLRNSVAYFREHRQMNDSKNFCIYEKVHIVRVTMAQKGLAFRIRFSTRRSGRRIVWKYSSRLITGSLVALSPIKDCFESICCVAVVASRESKNIEMTPPEVDIFFTDPDALTFDPQVEWVMIEARNGYYESSRHMLKALQKLGRESFPFGRYLCELSIDVEREEPSFNYESPVQVSPQQSESIESLSGTTQSSLFQRSAGARSTKLNTHQQQALKDISTRRIAIVQGPPGTGKTFVSVVGLRLLLEEMAKGDPPIVIATYTNHALDQLVCHISAYEKNFIRLGGRSNVEAIRNRTLFEVRNSQPAIEVEGGMMHPARRDMQTISSRIIALLKPFDKKNNGQGLTSSILLENGLITEKQHESLLAYSTQDDWEGSKYQAEIDPFDLWLEEQATHYEVDYSEQKFEVPEDDIDRSYGQLRELEVEQAPEHDEWDSIYGKCVVLDTITSGKYSPTETISAKALQEYLDYPDLWSIPVHIRGSIYNVLRRMLVDIVTEKIRRLAAPYMQACEKLQIGKWERDYEILKKAKIVAMTTTGLCKYRPLVNALKPRVIMVEEAAEVTEAPLAAACFESLEHLILVGDHQQLKGNTFMHQLSGNPFHLDMSMFERLINNGFPYTVLREQQRMVAEIRELLHPIYGQLVDHSSVQDLDLVPGMGQMRSYFYMHCFPERTDSFSSKINEFEANMVVEFVLYLLYNEVPSKSITILTFYNGQTKFISKGLKSHKYLMKEPVKVTTVDSYQGEENDVVILSLVRSNDEGDIGFLALENRVCVALSRARRGFYIFGNADCVKKKSKIWDKVIGIMSRQAGGPNIGSSLPLTCRRHGTQTMISAPGDWDLIIGGCKLECEETLKCGHTCPVKCHGFNHDWIICPLACKHIQTCCDVQCTQTCGTPHDHHCACTADNIPRPPLESDRQQPIIKAKQSSRKYAAAKLAAKKVARMKSTDAENNSKPKPRERVNIPRGKPKQQDKGLESWMKFADGGAKEIDQLFDALATSGDPNSIAVQRARARADESLIPEELKCERAPCAFPDKDLQPLIDLD